MNAAAAEVDLDSLAVGLSEVMRDFRKFCSLLPIRTKSQGIVQFEYRRWHDEQKAFERDRTGWDVVLKARQIGFSTLELARDLHHALTHPGHNVLVVVHDEKLKSQLFEALRIMAEALQELGLLPATRYSTKTELVFKDTGSAVRIVEAGETERSAEKKGRSGTVHRLHATEMAFYGAAGNTMAAVLSSVVEHHEGGELVIESTPNGAGGMFHETVKAAAESSSNYTLHFFPWWKHKKYSRPTAKDFDPKPRDDWEVKLRALGCTDKQISWWRTKVDDPNIGTDKALAEFPIDNETCFRAAGRTYIQATTTDYLATTVRPPLREARVVWKGRSFGVALIFANPLPGRRYVIGGDVAEGIGEDNHAAVVLDRATGQMMATFCCNDIEPGDFGVALCVLGYIYNTATIAPERNNHGHAAIRVITHTIKYKRIFRTKKDRRAGWDTNPATRPPLFDELHTACSTKAYGCPDARGLAEAKTLIIDKDGRPRARDKGKKNGCQDDLWIAWAIAHQVRSIPETKPGSFKFAGA